MQLHTKILLGLVLGGVSGVGANLILGDHPAVRAVQHYVAEPVGQIFLRLLFMIVMPLVFASIALGVASIGDLGRVGKLGSKAIAYFLATTALAAALGLVLVSIVEPGADLDPEVKTRLLAKFQSAAATKVEAAKVSSFGIETFVNIVTRNPLRSAVESDMLGVIFFGIMFGIGLTLIEEEKARPVIAFLEGLNAVVTKIVEIAMRLAPYGVAGLVFSATAEFGFALLRPLVAYVGVVLGALFLHSAVTLALILRFVIGMSPFDFVRRIRSALITAFSTSSSSATLPTNLAVSREQLGVPSQVGGFVLPLGTTMCMNGTALFEGVTVLFLAQVFGANLDVGSMIIVVTMCVITAVGAAAVPGGSIPLLVGILAMFGVPGESIAIVLGIDRILDMARTAVNVLGDHTAVLFVAKTEGLWHARDLPARVEGR